MTTTELLYYWGKTGGPAGYHPLLLHLLDVAAVCDALRPSPRDCAPLPAAWLPFLAGLHDIGKADPFFQNKDEWQRERLNEQDIFLPEQVTPFRHEARGAEWLIDYLMEAQGWGQPAAAVAAMAMRGHHGNFLCTADEDPKPSRRALWDQLRLDLAACLARVLQVAPCAIDAFPDAAAAGVRLSGLIVLADWLASNERFFPLAPFPLPTDLPAYLAAARARAAEVVDRLQLAPSSPPAAATPPCFTDLWPTCAPPRPTQAALDTLCATAPPSPGLAILEAPMGEGKTEAALYLATVWQQMTGRAGAYLALPTAATSNQMHARYTAFLRRHDPAKAAPRLVHGMAWLLDAATPDADTAPWQLEEAAEALEWFRPAKRALLADDGVGTVDQAMLAALNVKHGFLRLYGLARKVLVIDEVHAYDAYMRTILARLLAWCRALETPVILLSATLSAAQKAALLTAYTGTAVAPETLDVETYPLLTFAAQDEGVRTVPVPTDPRNSSTVQVQTHPGLLEAAVDTAALAVQAVAGGGCACVLANTVDAAQRIYQAIMKLQPADTQVLLFHARFRAERREELERTVVGLFGKQTTADSDLPRPARAILVATQVVEQSLDVDFDVMLSQVAPMDLLLQRCGRVWRHARGARPTGPAPRLHVLLPPAGTYDFGGSGRVYQPELLLRTLALLATRSAFTLPADFRPLIEGCYAPDAPPPAGIPAEVFAAARAARLAAMETEAQQARTFLIPLPRADEFVLATQGPQTEREDDAASAGSADFLHAGTRLGSRTRTVLVLDDPDLLATARAETPPPRDLLVRLFRQQVALPAWWLADLTTPDGDPLDLSGPRWLHGRLVLPLDDGVWPGMKHGTPVTIRDHPEWGVVYREDQEDAG